MRIRLVLLAIMTGLIMLMMVGQAWAGCSNPCPPGQNCIQVCMPELW